MTSENVPETPPTRRSLREAATRPTARPAGAPVTESGPPSRAARRAPSAPSHRRLATTSFSICVLGVVGLLTVGMTMPAQAVASSEGTGSAVADSATISVGSVATQAQTYAAPEAAEDPVLQRSTYSVASLVTSPLASADFDTEQGGLTLEQAQALIADYVSTADTAPLRKGEAVLEALYPGSSGPGDCGDGTTVDKLDNCVGFVTYFMNVYTSFDQYVYANGGQEATNMAAVLGRSTSTTPTVYSIGSDPSTSAAGHTFVVLGIQGDEAIIGEAGCGLTEGWPRARAVALSELEGDTFVNVADLILAQPRSLSELLGS
ncbi:MAG: hypothetical protein QM626_00615 [Microbacterium sp.]|uniref:hypothetical protein n=1 Tax=Microbacterium sp. TaxID=51671 RepID=UPI0039E5F883